MADDFVQTSDMDHMRPTPDLCRNRTEWGGSQNDRVVLVKDVVILGHLLIVNGSGKFNFDVSRLRVHQRQPAQTFIEMLKSTAITSGRFPERQPDFRTFVDKVLQK